jgi:hypothetical protein
MTEPRDATQPTNATAGSLVTRKRLLLALLTLFVFAVSFWQNYDAVDESPFHPDESRWINRAYYLRELFHPTSAIWEDRYITRGQPPMGSIITGFGLWVQGRSLDQTGPWDFHYGSEANVAWNVIKGNMPAAGDMMAARRTSAVVGALTCATLFLIVALLTNWFGGLIGALFLSYHPLQIYLSSIAVSDAIFTLFVALSMLAAIMLARKPTWLRAAVLAVVFGAGASTKLSPVFVAIGLAAGGAVFIVGDNLRRLPVIGRLWALLSRESAVHNRRLGWMLLCLPVIVGTFFVLTYPYLWPDPIGRTRILLDFRKNEMENQARIWPATAVDSRVEAVDRTWQNLEGRYSSTAKLFAEIGSWLDRDWSGHGIDVTLALAGFVLFGILALRRGLASPAMLAFVVLAGQSGVILANLRVDFNRYYLPLVFAVAVGVGMLAGELSRFGVLLGRNLLASQRENRPRAGSPLRPSPELAAIRRTTAPEN